MKRHYVIKADEREYDLHYRRRDLGELGDGLAYVHIQDDTEWTGAFDADTKVYATNSEYEAEKLAQHLSAKFAPNKYIVCSAISVYQAEVGPVKAAKFSDKGLLPA